MKYILTSILALIYFEVALGQSTFKKYNFNYYVSIPDASIGIEYESKIHDRFDFQIYSIASVGFYLNNRYFADRKIPVVMTFNPTRDFSPYFELGAKLFIPEKLNFNDKFKSYLNISKQWGNTLAAIAYDAGVGTGFYYKLNSKFNIYFNTTMFMAIDQKDQTSFQRFRVHQITSAGLRYYLRDFS
jgi:hypothetical protein